MHLANDIALGIPVSETGAMSFFLLQACGFMLEDSVQAIWHRYFSARTGTFERLVGYVWTAAFLSWTAAPWLYPANRLLTKDGTYLKWDLAWPVFVDARM